MSVNQDWTDLTSFSGAIKRAIREKKALPAIFVTLVALGIVLVALFAFSSSIITIVQSNYAAVVIAIAVIVAGILLFGIYSVRIIDEVSDSASPLIQEITELKTKLSFMEAHLATAQSYNNESSGIIAFARDALNLTSLHQFESYFEQLLLEIQQVESFKKVPMPTEDIKTTYVQQQEGRLIVTLPYGEKLKDIKGLIFQLERSPDNPEHMATFLGKASLFSVQDGKAFAVVQAAPLQQAFWDRVESECKDRGGGYALIINAKPALRLQFLKCSTESLLELQNLLTDIVQEIKASSRSNELEYRSKGDQA